MKIKQLFLKPIEREIEGVIKADDLDSLITEVEEYVITNEISKNLMDLMEQYNRPNQGNNGVWISGFFGSGKSHLLKMLALFLENRRFDDFRVSETLLSKLRPSEAMLKAEMKKAITTPSQSILFNIDQKADAISKSQADAVLGVFARVFDDFCGYYGQQGFIARFERDLDSQGMLEKFKDAFLAESGKSWHEGREAFNLNRRLISAAYARVTGNQAESARDIIQSYREDYHLSIEDFAVNVMKYIQQQPKSFRLNFFVDEVGQYVAENIKLMTNLQTIAESLATICKGQSWLFVTSQEDMSTVLGDFGQKQSNDFSKIRARFKCQMHLSSQDVAEVIQKRLLVKTEAGALEARMLYAREQQNFGTLFAFPDGGQSFRNFRDEADFVGSYPFIPYQYTLFQQAIESLSRHNAFTGKHNSVGERSMLGVFQDVVKAIAGEETGALGSFDLMFEGIRNAIKSTHMRAILNAEQHLDNQLAKRLLKALFMVKYVKSFRATPRNLRVLMQTRFDQDIKELDARILEALAQLEKETYIQRNNELYEYLTEEEQDIETEIKAVSVENEDVLKFLEDLFFANLIRDTKIAYSENGQVYSFAKRIDEKLRGREHELSIDFITPFSEFANDLVALKAHSMGKAEMMVVLPSDAQFMQDILMYKRTETYVKQNYGATSSETKNAIITNKSFQNSERKKAIEAKVKELLAEAVFIISGDQSEISGEDAKTRIVKAFNVLVSKIYTHLRMLGSKKYSEDEIKYYLEQSNSPLFGGDGFPLNEAEQEMLAYIKMSHSLGERTSMAKLEARFSAKPYGWYLAAIQCLVASLAGRGSLECWLDGNLQENGPLEKALKNTHGFTNLIIDPKKSVPAQKVQLLKNFYDDFFNQPTSETDARRLVKNIKTGMTDLHKELNNLYLLRSRYPFTSQLQPVLERMQFLLAQDFETFLNNLEAESEDWLDLKDTLIDPLLGFSTGAKQTIYDELVDFLSQKRADLHEKDLAKLQDLISDPLIYQGNRLQQARITLEGIQANLQVKLEAERQKALENIDHLQAEMQHMQDYQALSEKQQAELNRSFEQIRDTIDQQTLAVSIREKAGAYEVSEYTALLTKMHALVSRARAEVDQPPTGPQLTIVHINEIQVTHYKKILESAEDVNAYCRTLESAMLAAIQANKHIKI